jgi:hypothetical protein
MNLIYVKKSEIPLFKTRKPFLKAILKNKGVITYSNPECTVIQCDKKSAYRSISELHQIVKTRYKITSLRALLKIIKEIIDEEKCISVVWCTQINKVVVKYMHGTPGTYITAYSKDRYYESKGVDGYSLKDYQEIIDQL